VTVNEKAVPAVAAGWRADGVVRRRGGETAIELLVPEIEAMRVSVAVISAIRRS